MSDFKITIRVPKPPGDPSSIPDKIKKCDGCDKYIGLREEQYLRSVDGQDFCNECYAAFVLGLRMGIHSA